MKSVEVSKWFVKLCRVEIFKIPKYVYYCRIARYCLVIKMGAQYWLSKPKYVNEHGTEHGTASGTEQGTAILHVNFTQIRQILSRFRVESHRGRIEHPGL